MIFREKITYLVREDHYYNKYYNTIFNIINSKITDFYNKYSKLFMYNSAVLFASVYQYILNYEYVYEDIKIQTFLEEAEKCIYLLHKYNEILEKRYY